MNEAEKRSLLSMIGICKKAGAAVCGTDMICEALRRGAKAPAIVVISEDASKNTEKRLTEKLLERDYPEDLVQEAVQSLKEARYLDDRRFAEQYLSAHLSDRSIARIRQDQGPAMSFANARLVDSQLNDLGRNVYNRIPHSDFYSVTCGGGILGCTVIFNRAVAELIAAYGNPEKLIMHDSYAAILCTLFDGRIVFDAAPHMDYRQHGSNAVGTNWTKWDALKDRFYRITKGDDITVAHMAQSILAQDPQVPNKDKLAFLQKVADYPKSFGNAVSLALDTRPRYNGLSMQITMRLAMLFRNR
jgi:hypothetical protein